MLSYFLEKIIVKSETKDLGLEIYRQLEYRR